MSDAAPGSSAAAAENVAAAAPAKEVSAGKPVSDADKAANPLFGKAPSAEKLKKMQEKEAKKKAALAAVAAAQGQAAVGAVPGAAAAGGAAAPAAGVAGAQLSAAALRALEYAPKVPKGTRDSTPEQMAIREKCFGIIKGVFQRHGAVGIDTPVFELRETLTGKYGEDSKLIYDLADQGGELCSLRYDLTVPFARYLATHGLDNLKRYHIARVYRRDNPAMNKGRFREFYQCDFDCAGVFPLMVADSEVLKVLCEILEQLPGIGNFAIRLNHRKLLDGMMQLCGVPDAKLRPICSAIDKLDKEVWDCGQAPPADAATPLKCTCVKHEMTHTKGLDEAVADKLGELVKIKGAPLAVLAQLKQIPGFGAPAADSGLAEPQAAQGLRELEVLFTYLAAMGCIERFCFDLSLARGLDYYTGVIYEAAQVGESTVGSIAAGGRYDGLVGMFSGKAVPAVGVSIGIERVLSIVEEAEKKKGKVRSKNTAVYVASIGGGDSMLASRMALASSLWAAGVAAEYAFDVAPGWNKQEKAATASGTPFMVILGDVGDASPEAIAQLGKKAPAPFVEGQARIMDRVRKAPAGSNPLGELVPVADVARIIKQKLLQADREQEDQALAQSIGKVQL